MNRSESIAELTKALCGAQLMMRNAVKDSDNPFFKSRYADLASVSDACRAALNERGLAVIHLPTTRPDGLFMEYMLVHSSGEWIGSEIEMKPQKMDPQGVGSCITYYRRYTLASIAGVATEDDDGNAASGNKLDTKPQKQPKQESITIGPETEIKPETKYITEPQRKRLYAIVTQRKWIEEDVKDLLKEFGISSSKHIPNTNYDKICAIVETHANYGEYLDFTTNTPAI